MVNFELFISETDRLLNELFNAFLLLYNLLFNRGKKS
jgi:hypothetical protein